MIEEENYTFEHFAYIEHEDYPEIQNALRKNFKNAGILELLNELDNAENKPDKDKAKQATILTTFKRLIAMKLGLFDNEHAEYLIDTLPGYVEENERTINKLEQSFKSHRHATDKLYSEKPSW